jgi:hypothetical protein
MVAALNNKNSTLLIQKICVHLIEEYLASIEYSKHPINNLHKTILEL